MITSHRSSKDVSVTVKLLLSVSAIVLSIIAVQTWLNIFSARQRYETEEKQNLISIFNDYNDEVKVLERASAALASSFADRSDVQELLLAQNREQMLELLSPIFTTLRDDYGIVHLYVHQPNGFVFVRVHDPEQYGDAINTYRQTNVIALETHQAVAGVELGSNRLGVRGIAPVFHQNEFIGLVEVGLDYDQAFIEDLKARNGVDYKIWVTYDAAAPTGLWPRDEEMESPSSKLFFYASTNPNPLPIEEEVYLEVLHEREPEIRFVSDGNEDFAVLVAPLTGYGDRVIGVFEISASRMEALNTLRRHQVSTLVLAAALTVLALILMGISTERFVHRSLRHLTAVARRQLRGDLKARVELLPNDEFGQLGHTLNALTEELRNTLDNQKKIIEDLTQAERVQSTLFRIANAATRTKDFKELFESIHRYLGELIDTTNFYIALYEGEDTFSFPYWVDEYDEAGFSPKHMKKSLIAYVFHTGEPLLANENVHQELIERGEVEMVGTPSPIWLGVPLISDRGVIGVMAVQSYTDNSLYSENDVEMLSFVSDQIGWAIERKLTEETLRESEERYRSIFSGVQDAIIVESPSGEILDVNLGACRMFGWSREEFLTKTVDDLVPQDATALLADSPKGGELPDRPVETVNIRANGEPFPVEVSARLQTIGGDQVMLVVVRDITDRKRAEEVMIQSEKMLTVGGLAAGMAHEINNPLAGILHNTQVMRNRLTSDLQKNQRIAETCGTNMQFIEAYMHQRGIFSMIESVMESGQRAAKIVENMLSFSRKSKAPVSSHDLRDLLDHTIELASSDYDLRKKYGFRRIDIVREYDPTIPEVPCERTKIQQVFLNILKNSAQAMAQEKDEGKEPLIALRVQRDGDTALIEIEDNGPGMDDATRKRVFEPFFTTKGIGDDTGLGLSVSYFIITKNHGGTLSVESTPGIGAKFIIRLPLHRNIQ